MLRKIQLAPLGSIFLINLAVKWVIDNVLNIILMVKFGYIISLITTTILYVLIGIVSVKLYDWKKKDYFCFEDYKKNKKTKNKSRKLNRIVNFFKILILGLILSLKNTGLVVIFFRSGSHLYNGFAGKYIKLIFLSYALCINVFWNIVIYFFSPMFILAWETIKEIFILLIKNYSNFVMF